MNKLKQIVDVSCLIVVGTGLFVSLSSYGLDKLDGIAVILFGGIILKYFKE